MSCREWEHLLTDYVDGALSPEERARVEAHLASCPTCAAEVAAVQRVTPLVRALREAPPPQGLADAVFAKTTRRRRWLPRRFAPISAAAAVLVIVVALVMVYRNSEMSERMPAFDKGLETVSKEVTLAAPTQAQTDAVKPKEQALDERADTTVAGNAPSREAAVKPNATPAGPSLVHGVAGVGGGGGRARPALGVATTGTGRVGGPAPSAAPSYRTSAGDQGGAVDETGVAGAPTAAGGLGGQAADQRQMRARREAEAPPPPPSAEETQTMTADQLSSAAAAPIAQRWEAAFCGVTEPRTVVIDSTNAWNKLWGQVNANRLSPAAPPHLDFSQQVVVGVFLGTKTTGGWAVSITDVRLSDGALLVVAHLTSPASGMVVAQVLTQPYSIVVIPRTIDGQTITHETPVQVIWR